ncbi:hypothetical protein FQA39_LY07415 [Lamprigera yunnana]|nr:hypothetical protein FQA39_LY07415 [Lamprigera yunnana]
MNGVRFFLVLIFEILICLTKTEQVEVVKVSLYYESLCPFCSDFIVNQLYGGYQKIGQHLLLDLVPYGHTSRKMENGSWTFTCQHGSQECLINKLEACAIKRARNQGDGLQYVNCFESHIHSTDVKSTSDRCSSLINYLNGDKIWDCAHGVEGDKLMVILGEKTDSVNPPIKGVPRIIFNNHNDDDASDLASVDFLGAACKLFKIKPKECSDNKRKTSKKFNDTLKVSIYYEALCPDSARFITTQLHSTYEKIGFFLEVDLVPYGKASQTLKNNKWHFKCQHGPEECIGNKQQACALAKIDDQWKVVQFVNCLMSNYDPVDKKLIEECATALEISAARIFNCSESSEGDELLARYGNQTLALHPRVSFVPTIIYNDVFDSELHYSSLYNFLGTACTILAHKPNGCSSVLRINDYN